MIPTPWTGQPITVAPSRLPAVVKVLIVERQLADLDDFRLQ